MTYVNVPATIGTAPMPSASEAERSARPSRLSRLGGVGGGTGDAGRLDVHLVGDALQPVVRLGDARGGERVGSDDVGAGREVGVVNGPDDIRPGEGQEIVVATKVAGMVAEALAAEVGLGQAVALDERSGRAVEHDDPLREQRAEQKQALLARPDGACRRLS